MKRSHSFDDDEAIKRVGQTSWNVIESDSSDSKS